MEIDFKDWELPVYSPLFQSKNRYNILYGGRDSGKSFAAGTDLFFTIITKPNQRALLVRKTFVSIRKSQFLLLKDLIKNSGLSGYFKINSTTMEITFLPNGNSIFAIGLEEEDNAKSIVNPTYAWYEEGNELSFSQFIKTSQSLRTNTNSQIKEVITFNPENEEENFINSYFFPPKRDYELLDGNFNQVKPKIENTLIIHSTYKDNKYCTPDRQAILESLKNYSISMYNIYVLGLWGGALKGLVYEDHSLIDQFPQDCKWICFGLDFGYANDPTALIKVGYQGGRLIYHECFYQTGLVNSEISALLKEHGLTRKDEIVADSASPKDIEELRRMGWNIQGAKQKDIAYRIATIKSYPMVITKTSINLLAERKKYKYKENRHIPEDQPGHYLNEPIDMYNHGWDAAGYAVVYKIPKTFARSVKSRLPYNKNPDPLGLMSLLDPPKKP